ncbi:MAG TPA: lanthionine synthetase LanC family protein [Thermoanaerobaculia bacterium]|nr:lanthionine synthetase LanC family protein [Thermoanaerobaculia bacterium]
MSIEMGLAKGAGAVGGRAPFSPPAEPDEPGAERIARHLRRIARDVERRLGSAEGSERRIASVRASDGPPTPDGTFDLYLGVPGSALFLAALARVDGSSDDRERCLRAIAPLRRSAAPREAPPNGALTGTAGAVYALSVVAHLLDEPSLLDDAHRLADRIDLRAIAEDRFPDVACGSAGTLLCLLALGPRLDQPGPRGRTPRDLALRCADRLLVWCGEERRVRSGFSHGASGVATALARLAAVTGREDLASAALRLLARERDRFDAAAGRWTVSEQDPLASPCSWCFGAPGLALARLAVAEHVAPSRAAALREEAETALEQTLTAPPDGGLDHLCCGVFGRVETLLVAHRLTGRPDLAEGARALAHRALDAAEEAGGFRIDHPSLAASFFRGVAGIGYALLRLGGASDLPSPLHFEAPFPP